MDGKNILVDYTTSCVPAIIASPYGFPYQWVQSVQAVNIPNAVKHKTPTEMYMEIWDYKGESLIDLLCKADTKNLQFATDPELYAYMQAFPDAADSGPIIAAGTKWKIPAKRPYCRWYHPYASFDKPNRYQSLILKDVGFWPGYDRLLFVRYS